MSTVATHEPLAQRVWRLLEEVKDPEIPVLSVVDLGIARDVLTLDEAIGLAQRRRHLEGDADAVLGLTLQLDDFERMEVQHQATRT